MQFASFSQNRIYHSHAAHLSMAVFKLHGLAEEYEGLRALLLKTTGDKTPAFGDMRPAARLCGLYVCGLHAERLLTMEGASLGREEKGEGEAASGGGSTAVDPGATPTTTAGVAAAVVGGGGGGGGPEKDPYAAGVGAGAGAGADADGADEASRVQTDGVRPPAEPSSGEAVPGVLESVTLLSGLR